MKKYLYTTLLVGILSLLSSCEKYLDIKPKGYVIPQTVEDYERILNDISLTKMLADGLEKLSDDYYDPALVEGTDVTAVDYRLYFWLPSPYSQPDDFMYASYWNLLYNQIYQYNAVINGIDGASGATEQRKNIARGRALVGRAICYYYLNNIYGQIPKTADDQTALGVPLVVSNKLTDHLPARSTTWGTFDFIVNDLLTGISLIPASSPSNYQINRMGAYGWLARTYLTMKDYKKAQQAAVSALELNNTLLDYNSQYEVQRTTDGTSFYVPKTGASIMTPQLNPENMHIIFFSYTRGMAFQQLAKQTLDAFDTHDLRRINIVPSYSTTGDVKNWDGRFIYMGVRSYEYSAGPTTAEMYLILAESLVHDQKYAEALDKINLLRKNRIEQAYYQPLVHENARKTMTYILKERRAELLFKSVRWFDMRRFQNDPEFGFTAVHELANGQLIKLAPNSPRYTMSIPDRAINDQITQNP
ncbi:RagB/SusD family nutrient uptake outer membrane protein [Sphingobacterium ginsenosidimutans]|uniref:RagB/SusD family nutrient uptake outer membrane protein n=1 Tax=Sphingobacterium ginsenosidimutans TaxID=687845 RepID=A0ABP8A603_9SPHI